MTYTVLEKSGPVRAWLPWSARWRAIGKGQKLTPNALVVVGAGATLVYEARDQFDRADVLTIKTPLTFRVGSGEVRSLKLKPQFLTNLPEELLKDWDPDEQMPLSLKHAWERQLALLKPSAENQAALAGRTQQEDQKVALDVGSQAIKILTPKDRSVLIAQGMPLEVELAWKGEGRARPPYIVSVWKDGEKPRVVARTDETQHRITFDDYGDYTVAVQSVADGQASEPTLTRFSVMRKVGAGIVAATLELMDTLPPRDFTIAARNGTVQVDFAWKEVRPLALGEYYQLELANEKGVVQREERGDRPFFSMNVPVGPYVWTVRLVRKDAVALVAAPRKLTVASAGALAAADSGVLYLEGGL